MSKRWILMVMATFLSACSSMNGDFECGRVGGLSCQPAYNIDRMIDQGRLSDQAIDNWKKSAGYQAASRKERALRNPERVMRIWVAPFEDKAGKWHTSHRNYQVVEPGQWKRGKNK